MEGVGRFLIVFGVVAVIAGIALLALPRLPWLGRLPGDLVIERERFTLYVPLATSLVVSIVLSVLFALFFRR